jgi:hypothetical protein
VCNAITSCSEHRHLVKTWWLGRGAEPSLSPTDGPKRGPTWRGSARSRGWPDGVCHESRKTLVFRRRRPGESTLNDFYWRVWDLRKLRLLLLFPDLAGVAPLCRLPSLFCLGVDGVSLGGGESSLSVKPDELPRQRQGWTSADSTPDCVSI